MADRPHARTFRQWLALACLLAVTLAAYQPAWHGEPLWDDDGHLTPAHLEGAAGLRRIWIDIGATQQYYPVLHSSFWLMHRLWAHQTLGYHIVNITLHALSAFLVLCILRHLAVPGAMLASVIFALHPVHVESVAWITELKNTLSGVFYLAAALTYLSWRDAPGASEAVADLRAKGRRRLKAEGTHGQGRAAGRSGTTGELRLQSRASLLHAAALALFVFAVLSKSVTATLPAALLVILWWRRGALSWRADIGPLVPFFVIGIAAGLLTAWVERTYIGAAGGVFELPLLERVLLAARIPWFYLTKLVWPSNLTFVYPRWQIDAAEITMYLPLVATVGLLSVLWRLRHRTRAPVAAALLFGGTLFPVLGFFNVFPFRYSYVADHFQYLASIPAITLAASGIVTALGRLRRRVPEGLVAAALGVVLAILTWQQSHYYANAETLYRVTLERNPSCWLCHNNLAVIELAAAEDRSAIALAHIEAGLRLNPLNEEGHNNRGAVLRTMGEDEEAIRSFREAVRLSPNYPDARMNLGLALQSAGRLEEALEQYEHLRRLGRQPAEAERRIGSVLLELGRPAEALPHLERSLALRGNDARTSGLLGIALARVGRFTDALQPLGDAVRLAPDDGEARNNLASAYLAAGQHDEAVRHYRESLRVNPSSAKAHDNLGYALLGLGRRAEAADHFEAALRADAGYAPANVNVGNLLVDAGRPLEAIAHYQKALESRAAIDLAQVHSNLGVAYAMAGRHDTAVQHFREALRLRPDFPQARSNLDRALGRRR